MTTAVAEQLDHKLVAWNPEAAAQVEQLIAEIIEWTDSEALDILHTREVEQEVLDLLDESYKRGMISTMQIPVTNSKHCMHAKFQFSRLAHIWQSSNSLTLFQSITKPPQIWALLRVFA